jgi:hypothetical protein
MSNEIPAEILAEILAVENAHRRPPVEPAARAPEPLSDGRLRELLEEEREDAEYRAQRQAERDEAVHRLKIWAYAHARRDEFVRVAYAAGVSVRRIHKLTGIARTTIDRILADSGS